MTGTRFGVFLAFGWSLIFAAHLGAPGIAAWGAVWSVVVYRAASKPRTRGAHLTKGQETSDAWQP